MKERPPWIDLLVERLLAIAADPDGPDRAILAHLRRSLSETTDRTLAKVGWLFVRVPELDVDRAILLAGLFALTKGDCPQTDNVNFGKAFGTVAQQKQDSGSTEKRFIDLLDTDATELPNKLRHAMTMVANAGMGLDWKQLGHDLIRWPWDSRLVQKAWARSYWGTLAPSDEADGDEADDTTNSSEPQTIS